jgi:hypothetical protein
MVRALPYCPIKDAFVESWHATVMTITFALSWSLIRSWRLFMRSAHRRLSAYDRSCLLKLRYQGCAELRTPRLSPYLAPPWRTLSFTPACWHTLYGLIGIILVRYNNVSQPLTRRRVAFAFARGRGPWSYARDPRWARELHGARDAHHRRKRLGRPVFHNWNWRVRWTPCGIDMSLHCLADV